MVHLPSPKPIRKGFFRRFQILRDEIRAALLEPGQPGFGILYSREHDDLDEVHEGDGVPHILLCGFHDLGVAAMHKSHCPRFGEAALDVLIGNEEGIGGQVVPLGFPDCVCEKVCQLLFEGSQLQARPIVSKILPGLRRELLPGQLAQFLKCQLQFLIDVLFQNHFL